MEELPCALQIVCFKFYPEMLRECGLKVPFEDGYFEEIVEKLEKKLHA